MRRLALAVPVLAVLAASVPAAAQDVSGVWEISWETPRGAQTVVFTFRQDGTALTGSAEMSMGRRGGGGGRVRTVEISSGSMEDGEIAFELVMGGGQRSFTMSFAGTVDGGVRKGTVTNPMGGENPFTGKRKEN